MPKETIRRLGVDLERVLVAGAHLVTADPEIAKDKLAVDKLAEKLGAKAPALKQLAEATARAVVANDKDAPKEVLGLLAMVSRIRTAQAGLAPAPGDLTPLLVVPPLGTPCNARSLDDIHDALVKTGSGRMEKVDNAIESGQIADLRLAEAVCHALGDSYIGETVATKAAPLFGRALVAPIRERFDKKGGAVQTRRLRALVAVERADAAPLLEEVVRDGSPAVREAALDAVSDFLRGEPRFEELALDVLATDKSADVRRAAVRALAGYGSQAAFEALLKALDATATRAAAAEALGACKHPDAVARLLERLDAALADFNAKPKKGEKATDAAKKARDQEKAQARGLASLILEALGGHADPRVAARAVDLMEEFGALAARAVVAGGSPAQRRSVADALESENEDLYGVAAAAAVELGEPEAFERLSRAFGLPAKNKRRRSLRLHAIIRALPTPIDKRWFDVASAQLAAKEAEVDQIVHFLGRIGDRRAVELLVPLLEANTTRNAALRALGDLKDPSAIDPIVEHLKKLRQGDYWMVWLARGAFIQIGDATVMNKLRDALVATKEGSGAHTHLAEILRQLSHHFPGH